MCNIAYRFIIVKRNKITKIQTFKLTLPGVRCKISASNIERRTAFMEVNIKAEPESITLDTKRTALIVVDMQNAFCKKGGMMDYFGKLDEAMIERTTNVCQRIIAISRDMDIPIIYLRMTYGLDVDANLGPESPFYWKEKGLKAEQQNPELKDKILHHRTWGWEIIDELKPENGDIIINKSRYSGFVNTNLDATLKTTNRKYLLFTGVFTNICVESTLRDAFHREYFSVLIRDACGAMGNNQYHDTTVWNVQSAFGWVTSSDDLIKSLKIS